MSERYLTINAAAERISMSRATVYRLISRGQLQTVSIAGRRRVPESAIEALVSTGDDPCLSSGTTSPATVATTRPS